MKTNKTLSALLLSSALMSLVSCGGSSGTGGATKGKGTATITFSWPERSRLIYGSANSVVIKLTGIGQALDPSEDGVPSGSPISERGVDPNGGKFNSLVFVINRGSNLRPSFTVSLPEGQYEARVFSYERTVDASVLSNIDNTSGAISPAPLGGNRVLTQHSLENADGSQRPPRLSIVGGQNANDLIVSLITNVKAVGVQLQSVFPLQGIALSSGTNTLPANKLYRLVSKATLDLAGTDDGVDVGASRLVANFSGQPLDNQYIPRTASPFTTRELVFSPQELAGDLTFQANYADDATQVSSSSFRFNFKADNGAINPNRYTDAVPAASIEGLFILADPVAGTPNVDKPQCAVRVNSGDATVRINTIESSSSILFPSESVSRMYGGWKVSTTGNITKHNIASFLTPPSFSLLTLNNISDICDTNIGSPRTIALAGVGTNSGLYVYNGSSWSTINSVATKSVACSSAIEGAGSRLYVLSNGRLRQLDPGANFSELTLAFTNGQTFANRFGDASDVVSLGATPSSPMLYVLRGTGVNAKVEVYTSLGVKVKEVATLNASLIEVRSNSASEDEVFFVSGNTVRSFKVTY